MRSRIVVMMLLAVGGGAVSLFAAQAWLDRAADARLSALDAPRPATNFGTLVVAAEPLRFGAVLSASNLKTIPWPADDLPANAFADVDAVLKDGTRTVLTPLEAFEPILVSKMTGPGETATLSRLVTEGYRAVSLRVDDVAGVAGFLLPGDRVDVVLTRDADGTNTGDVILQGVKVLTVDQSADERAQTPQVARAVTVEVDPAGAQKLALAQAVGSLSLALRPAGEVARTDVPGISAADLGQDLSPPPVEAIASVAPARPSGATVWVTRAHQRTSYTVPTRGTIGAIVEGPRDDGPRQLAAVPDAAAEDVPDEKATLQ